MNIGIVSCKDSENPVQINFGMKSNVLPFCKSHFFIILVGEVVAIISQVKKMGQLFGILYISEYNTNSWDHSLRMQ